MSRSTLLMLNYGSNWSCQWNLCHDCIVCLWILQPLVFGWILNYSSRHSNMMLWILEPWVIMIYLVQCMLKAPVTFNKWKPQANSIKYRINLYKPGLIDHIQINGVNTSYFGWNLAMHMQTCVQACTYGWRPIGQESSFTLTVSDTWNSGGHCGPCLPLIEQTAMFPVQTALIECLDSPDSVCAGLHSWMTTHRPGILLHFDCVRHLEQWWSLWTLSTPDRADSYVSCPNSSHRVPWQPWFSVCRPALMDDHP